MKMIRNENVRTVTTLDMFSFTLDSLDWLFVGWLLIDNFCFERFRLFLEFLQTSAPVVVIVDSLASGDSILFSQRRWFWHVLLSHVMRLTWRSIHARVPVVTFRRRIVVWLLLNQWRESIDSHVRRWSFLHWRTGIVWLVIHGWLTRGLRLQVSSLSHFFFVVVFTEDSVVQQIKLVSNTESMITSLTSKAFQVIVVAFGSHDHLKGRDALPACWTCTCWSKESVVKKRGCR